MIGLEETSVSTIELCTSLEQLWSNKCESFRFSISDLVLPSRTNPESLG